MGYLDNLNAFFPSQAGKVTGPKKQEGTQHLQQVEHTQQAQKPETKFTVDSSELEIKAEMNKALGFVKSNPDVENNYAKADAEFAKDPIAFAQKYASPEVRKNAESAAAEFDANAIVLRTLSPERQEQVIAGFSQRNENPRAFTGEFLDLFSVA